MLPRLLLCLAAMLPFRPSCAADPGLPALTGGEEVRNAVSARLVEMKAAQRDKQRPLVERTIADIQRVNHLSEDRLQMLCIVGRGIIEHAGDSNDLALVKEMDSRTKGVSPKLVTKVLAGIDEGSSDIGKATEQPRWREAVQRLLTPQEYKLWEKVVAEREAYRVHAIAELGLMQVQSSVDLTDDQTQALLPLMEKAVRDYLPDLASMFGSDPDDRSFYTGYVPVFILGIAEKEARAIVKIEQWSKWQSAAGDCAGSWSWIKQLHDSRAGKGKP
jgi:hypothetical protein